MQLQAAPVKEAARVIDPASVRDVVTTHALHAEGVSIRQIARRLDRSTSTIRRWLGWPAPTAEELEAAAVPPVTPQKKISQKIYLDPDLDARAQAEAQRQGCSRSQLGVLALRLYLDAVDRSRSGSSEPLNLYGYSCD